MGQEIVKKDGDVRGGAQIARESVGPTTHIARARDQKTREHGWWMMISVPPPYHLALLHEDSVQESHVLLPLLPTSEKVVLGDSQSLKPLSSKVQIEIL